MKKLGLSVVFLSSLTLAATGCGKNSLLTTTQQASTAATPTPSPLVPSNPIKLSFFLTNDLHGHLENMGIIGGIVQQLRNRDEYTSGTAGFIVLDSGDQFQGTLISNYDEGDTVFKSLNAIGYDAVIPGNHDYDFGPKNWQYDRVTPGVTSNDPREVIEDLSGEANFPMLSANTYFKASLNMTGTQTSVAVDDSCVPTTQSLSSPIDFINAKRPTFLKPYAIIQKAGVRIALIGIDNKATTSVTTSENVSDLCFRDEAEAYLEIRKSLEGQADVFVMLMHNGNVLPSTFMASDIVQKINTTIPGAVDLVAAGHTHVVHNNLVGQVHVMQDGCNAYDYGRVDLYVDPITKKVLADKTDSRAGIKISATTCSSDLYCGDPGATCAQATSPTFACSQLTLPIQSLAAIDALVATENQNVASIGMKQVAVANAMINVSRVGESALGDVMADALRTAGGTQIAFMNAGGLRTSIKKGVVLYQDLFQVTPFGNLGVVMNALPWKNLKSILNRTIKTDGAYGTLEESGLKITYYASNPNNTTQLYNNSQLLHVELVDDGTVLFDQAKNIEVPDTATFSVTTLDYLADGGDGFDFLGTPVNKTMQIARDLIANVWTKNNQVTVLLNGTDNRFVNTAAAK